MHKFKGFSRVVCLTDSSRRKVESRSIDLRAEQIMKAGILAESS